MNRKHAQLTALMTAYNAGDPKRIQHFIKVFQLASVIGTLEQVDEETLFVLETAAIVHDIGIRICEQKYHMDYQILVEADFLVNIYEDELPAENIRIIKQCIFRTPTGIRLLEDMYEKK